MSAAINVAHYFNLKKSAEHTVSNVEKVHRSLIKHFVLRVTMIFCKSLYIY